MLLCTTFTFFLSFVPCSGKKLDFFETRSFAKFEVKQNDNRLSKNKDEMVNEDRYIHPRPGTQNKQTKILKSST